MEVVGEAAEQYPATPMTIAITGSGGLLLAQWLGIDFVQEVIASKTAVETFIPQTDVVIELGGEDAKIIYFDNGIEQRMNGTCAGGTGAFIDQMAALLDTDAGGLNELGSHTTIYPIAEPLRRVRQNRRAAAFERRRPQRRHRGLHFPGRRNADHFGPRAAVPSAATSPCSAALCSISLNWINASAKR